MKAPFSLLAILFFAYPLLAAEPPVALRAESLTVGLAQGPVLSVRVKNLSDKPFEGTISVKVPDNWTMPAKSKTVSVAVGQTGRVSFPVETGAVSRDNSYPVEVSAVGNGATVVRKQNVVCATAPYSKPTIDGDSSDWKNAVPVKFVTDGKNTTISTLWNRRQFCILVQVEEDKLLQPGDADAFDAVQVAISPQDTTTADSEDEEATRFEFLLTADEEGSGNCYQLAQPGMKLSVAATERKLDGLDYDAAEVAVTRADGVTCYECSIPFTQMRSSIRPGEGREFFLSVLVHDPDGTGVRDWGEAVGMWESQRNRLAWGRWVGAKWGDKPPMDNKTEWGMCSSLY